MNINLDTATDTPVLKLHGRFDAGVGFDFFAMSVKAMHANDAGDIVIDLADVNYIDSSGIGKLIFFSRQLRDKARKLVLVNLQPQVASTFKLMQIEKIITIH